MNINDKSIYEYPYKFEGGEIEKSNKLVDQAQNQTIKTSKDEDSVLELNSSVILAPKQERTLAAITEKINSKLGMSEAIVTRVICKDIECDSGPFNELIDIIVQKIATNELDEVQLGKFPANLRLYSNLF